MVKPIIGENSGENGHLKPGFRRCACSPSDKRANKKGVDSYESTPLAEHQGVEPWHRSPGLSHFEFFLLHGTWWKIEGISPLCQKIRTIEFTLKISSRSQITRLCADLNPLSKTQKNQPFGENWERFYARWRERAREIPGAKIHPYNMLPSDADQIKAAKDG